MLFYDSAMWESSHGWVNFGLVSEHNCVWGHICVGCCSVSVFGTISNRMLFSCLVARLCS